MSSTPKYDIAEFNDTKLEGHIFGTWHVPVGYATGLALQYEFSDGELGSAFVSIMEVLISKGYSMFDVEVDHDSICGELIIKKDKL